MEGFKGKSEVARILVGCALKVAQSLAFCSGILGETWMKGAPEMTCCQLQVICRQLIETQFIVESIVGGIPRDPMHCG